MVRAAVLVILATSNAFAGGPPGLTPVVAPQEVPRAVLAPKEEPVENYAIQTLASDATTVVLFLAASRRGIDSETAASYGKLGLTTFVLGPPIIHLCHARGGAFLASLGMRVGAIALTVAALKDEDDGGDGAFGPLIVGGLAASIVDAAWLARADDPPLPKRPIKGTWQPTIGASHQAFSLGVAGNF